MNSNILVSASALSDQDLLARLEGLAGREREALAEVVGHLAALDSRALLYAAQGYGSLFSYCTHALRLSEDAACNRIEAARACRRFPLILDLLASGALSLTSVRLLAPHLTAENHESGLARAMHKTRREIEALVAELAPRADLPSSVRKIPCRSHAAPLLAPAGPAPGPWPELALGLSPGPAPGHSPAPTMISVPSLRGVALALSHGAPPVSPRPIVRASAPERYRVQFTIGQETHEKLRRLQALLRREIPDGDPGTIFDRALTVLLEKVERTKLAATVKPRPKPAIRPETDSAPAIRPKTDSAPPIRPTTHLDLLIRPGTDSSLPIRPETDTNSPIRPAADTDLRKPGHPSRTVPPAMPSRHVPRAVKREAWRRDAGQCAFVSTTGRRCAESTFLEFHHVQPYAKQGPATVANISLRCWRHNQYEAELVFGPHRPSMVREARLSS